MQDRDRLKRIYAETYDADRTQVAHAFPDKHELLTHLIGDRAAGKRALDFGCGAGSMVLWLSQQAEEVIGVDMTPEALSQIERRGVPQNVRLVCGDENGLKDLMGEKEGFDFITCIGTLEHTDSPQGTLIKLAEAALPGAQIWIQVPSWQNPRGDIYHTLRTYGGLEMTKTDRHWITPMQMGLWAKEAGLSLENIIGGHYRLGWADRMAEDLIERLAHNHTDNVPQENKQHFFQWMQARKEETRVLFSDPSFEDVPNAQTETLYCSKYPWNMLGASATYVMEKM